jgi:hypothetical protein
VGRRLQAQDDLGLNNTVPDTALVVTYQPGSSSSSNLSDPYGDYSDSLDDPSTTLSTVTKQFLAPWPVNGQSRSFATVINAMIIPNPIGYGGFVAGIEGDIDGPSAAQTVTLYKRTAGSSTETLVATTTATPFNGVLTFEFPLFATYTTNTYYRVHVDGTDTSTGGDQTTMVAVRANVSLKSSATKISKGKTITLTSSVYPATSAGGKVVFERLSGKKWIAIATKTLSATGSKAVASTGWKPGKGTFKVRARYTGGTFNATSTSGNVTVSVK